MSELAESMQPVDPVEPPPGLVTHHPLQFTGTGGEYFRIWVVNLLLTIVTLGIYSAWAKVRKTRFFWSNTRLDGAAFQYHGRPAAILRGRILVGVIFVVYSLVGRISVQAGVVAAAILGVLAPWFFYSAMRFKLSNTTWRGVRFGFHSTVGEAYRALAPAVVLGVALSASAATLQPGDDASPAAFLVVYALFLALVPFLHARIKRYQHGATSCGDQRFELEPSTGAFYKLYGKTLLITFVPMILVAIAVVAVVAAFAAFSGTKMSNPPSQRDVVAIVAVAYAAFLLVSLLPGSYFTANLQRLVWTRTHGGPVRFSTTVGTRALMWLWFKNGLLTLLTLGIYWPWAAVNLARYKLECMTVEAAAPLGSIAAGAQGVERSAAGDGAIDFFGWDVGL
jgi:uncharacterized membrane protein YjgN (DUF898 family)